MAPTGGQTAPAAWGARTAAIAALALVAAWVQLYLGGVAAGAELTADGTISTDRLFNWHPLLMVAGFGIFMTEGMLAYRAPLWRGAAPRPQRKLAHWLCHTAAAACIGGGMAAVWRSHTLKQPPIPNLYSPHSWLGLAALSLAGVQYALGVAVFLWRRDSTPQAARAAFAPRHRFLGRAAYVTALAAAGAGLQEKATFLQAFGGKPVRSAFLVLPAAAELALLATGLLALAAHAAAEDPRAGQAPLYVPVGVGDSPEDGAVG